MLTRPIVVVPAVVALLATVAGVAVAVHHRAMAPAATELTRDLEIASAPVTGPYALTETAPMAAPTVATVVKRAPSGTKAVHAHHPTVKAAPEPREVAASEEPTTTETVAAAPVPGPAETPADQGAATPRPTAIPISLPSGPSDQGAVGQQGSGASGIGAVLGGILGAVIRGGGVDGDHCEIHDGPGRGRRRGGGGGPVYMPNPSAPTTDGSAGPWGSHFPANPITIGTRGRSR